MIKIGLFGAMDRYNYGDLLFSIILEKWLREQNSKVSFNYYGMIESDLSAYGAVKTKSIEKAFTDKNDVLIIVGGEVLTAKWTSTYLYLLESNTKIFINRVINKILNKELANKLARRKLRGQTNFPYIIPKSKLENTKIIYNTVGGADFSFFNVEKKNILKEEISQSDYCSVRDPLTKKNLEQIGVSSVFMYPDSAIIMSKFFWKEVLEKKINDEAREIVRQYSQGYICFQVGRYLGKNYEDVISRELIKIYQEKNLNIVLLPIGRAAFHEDHIILNKIKNIIGEKANVILAKENGIYETMYLISQAQIFVGTSLHGNITALSYGIPCVGLDKRVLKIGEFMKQFSINEQLYSVDYKDISESIKYSLDIPREKLKENAGKLIELAYENFENIYKQIIL